MYNLWWSILHAHITRNHTHKYRNIAILNHLHTHVDILLHAQHIWNYTWHPVPTPFYPSMRRASFVKSSTPTTNTRPRTLYGSCWRIHWIPPSRRWWSGSSANSVWWWVNQWVITACGNKLRACINAVIVVPILPPLIRIDDIMSALGFQSSHTQSTCIVHQ